MPVDYQKGKIYTIRCYDDDSLIYVGSTTQPLAVRWGDHKKCCYQDNPKVSICKLMKDKGRDKFYMELYEDFPCERKEQLIKREGEVQRLIATVNKVVAGRTNAEWYIDNKEQIAEKDRKYYENNKEKILYGRKKYYENNREKSLHRRKKYYENNKEKELARMAEKITCDNCGSIICRRVLPRHQKTKKCEELSRNKICPIINDE